MLRTAEIERKTNETAIRVRLSLDEVEPCQIETGIAFLDHMLQAFAKHGRFALTVCAKGDLQVDAHHTMEDLGLVLGQALRQALGDKSGIERFGSAAVPMDDALARVVVDLSGRPYLGYRVQPQTIEAGGVNVRLFREFFQALVNTGGVTLHIDLLAGEEIHHIIEAVFKAFGRALAQAMRVDPRVQGVLSTKGVLG
jgi:imidazoleglycerol-phosphate dehydratase